MIIFENDGAIDIRAIKTFGVNSKDNKESAIGYFGTGLKYAIAILLRSGHKVSIITNGTDYEFGISRSKIRNDHFDIITMNGDELGYTTELGKNWDTWMAFRELYSNMLDEEGSKAYRAGLMDSPQPDKTYVLVDGPEIGKLYDDRYQYFLHEEAVPLHQHDEVDIYNSSSAMTDGKGSVFYKGVRVMQTRNPALFDYNHHTGLTLTEDRTIRDSWSTLYHVSRLVTSSQDKALITKMVMCDPEYYEANIDFNIGFLGGRIDTFLDVVGELRKKYKDIGVSPTAIILHTKHRKITSVLPGISCHLNKVEQMQFDKAVMFCKDTLDLQLDDYKLIVAKDLGGDDNLGRANIELGIMYISKQCFREGTKRVAVAILEEYTHCHHRVKDETVAQKWVYLNQIMSLGENLQGEPL